MSKKKQIATCELLLKEGVRTSTCTSPRAGRWECAQLAGPEDCVFSQVYRLRREQFAGDTSTHTWPMRVPLSSIFLPLPWGYVCHPAPQLPRTGRLGWRAWRERDLQYSQERKWQRPSAEPLVPTKKQRLGLGQQLNSSLHVDWAVDMPVTSVKFGQEYFVLNKSVARNKQTKMLDRCSGSHL
jgi:hypothetical protein